MTAFPYVGFCVQYATHMSIGLLFLGGGRLGLRTNDPFATVCLLISSLPPFPPEPNTYSCVPQLIRHLYVLAVESRLLTVSHLDEEMATSGNHIRPLEAKVHVELKNSDLCSANRNPESAVDHLEIVGENLCVYRLPPISDIVKLSIRSEGYWPIDFNTPKEVQTELRAILEKDGLIVMKPRPSDVQIFWRDQTAFTYTPCSGLLVMAELEKVFVAKIHTICNDVNGFSRVRIGLMLLEKFSQIFHEMNPNHDISTMIDTLRRWLHGSVFALMNGRPTDSLNREAACLKAYLLLNDNEMDVFISQLNHKFSEYPDQDLSPLVNFHLLKSQNRLTLH